MNKKKKVVDPTYAKGKGEYEKVINSIQEIGECPFCPKNFKYHKNKFLKKEGGWTITQNSWPYPNAKHHFIIISEKHKEKFEELTAKDFVSTSKLVNWAIKKYKLPGGGLTIRFGQTEYTGATVCHLHFHLISPQRIKNKTKPVYFPIG